ncbi:cilia- and flagella-associated protein 20-like [Polistes fuscatus]|uniref:cilia- and flagella-associated protein 20-like n=1 Tax=Polistes fuscatus TaxID=30207 RepID=UPI001CA801D4|nr:cilia- and flagella-associated protein 20-like [Polistes fuscatus]
MFRNTYQRGFVTILYSCGPAPLELWGMHVKNGYIRRIIDDEVKSLVLELAGTNVATTYIYCPAEKKKVLGISLPFLIIIIKNMKRYFTFEITILDDKNMHRRFRVSNFQSTTRVRPFCTTMPIGLSNGWNQIQFNLADFTRRAYGTNYVETTRMQMHANCRIRRIYFSSRLYNDEELPAEYKLFLPIHQRKCVREKVDVKSISKHEKPEVEEPPILYKTPSEQVGSEETKEKGVDDIEVPSEVSVPLEETEVPETKISMEEEIGEDEEYDVEEHEYKIDDRHIFEDEEIAIEAAMAAVEEHEDEEEDLILDEIIMEDEG